MNKFTMQTNKVVNSPRLVEYVASELQRIKKKIAQYKSMLSRLDLLEKSNVDRLYPLKRKLDELQARKVRIQERIKRYRSLLGHPSSSSLRVQIRIKLNAECAKMDHVLGKINRVLQERKDTLDDLKMVIKLQLKIGEDYRAQGGKARVENGRGDDEDDDEVFPAADKENDDEANVEPKM